MFLCTNMMSGSLCNALGRLMPPSERRPHDSTSIVTLLKDKNGRKSKALKTEVAKKENTESILSTFDENAKKVLTSARMRMMIDRESEIKPTGGRKRPIDYEIVKEVEVEAVVVAEDIKPIETTEAVPAQFATVEKRQRKGGKAFNPRNDGPFCVLQFRVPFHLNIPVDVARVS